MKVLMIAPTPFFADRGTHIRIWEEARALEQLGHEVQIVTYHIGNDIQKKFESTIVVKRINRLLFWYKKMEAGPDWQKVVLDLLLARKTWSVARQWKPDVMHAHLHEGVLIGWLVQKMLFWRKLPMVADFHGSLTGEMLSHSYLRGGFMKRLFRKLEKWLNNRGEAAVTSSWENTQSINADRASSDAVSALDGSNCEAYQAAPDVATLRSRFELPQEKQIVVYTGALIPNKGTHYLYEAIVQLRETHPDAFFVLAGYPGDSAQRFIAQHSLEDHVRLISPLPYVDLPALLQACDIAIDPKDSASKQASGKILQYMAAGLPIVCFDRTNNRQYLGDGAVYAKDISGNGLAAAIAETLDDPRDATDRGSRNAHAAQEFSWIATARILSDIYSSL
jgi:glycosyltransferase involved in cell wall biosynthesis